VAVVGRGSQVPGVASWTWTLLLACASPPEPSRSVPPVDAERPDIVLVSIDTLRADRLSAWGYERPTSPVLDALAARSTRWSQAVAPAPWTLPSMASIYTGQMPSEHGVVGPELALAPSQQTLAEALSDRGYDAAFFGVNPIFVDGHGLDQGFATFRAWPGLSGRQLNEEVRGFLRQRDEGRPLFLAVHYLEPHCRYRPPRDVADRFLDPSAPVVPLAPDRYEAMGDCFRLQQADGSPELDLSVYRARYDAEVFEADRLVGELLSILRARDPWVAVVGDHGEAFWEHGDFGHGRQLYEEQIHVPLVLHAPGGRAQRDDAPRSTTWLFGALLAAADGAPLPPADPLVFSETAAEEHHLAAVRRGADKLILDLDSGALSAFDLAVDPDEQVPVALDEELAAALAERAGRSPPPAVPQAVTPETRRQLQALGYADPDP